MGAVSDYAPGTVAMVTYNGKRLKVMRVNEFIEAESRWRPVNGTRYLADADVSDITPLVCIEATREDADLLANVAEVSFMDLGARATLGRVVAAIREQTPEPLVIPENLGAVVEDKAGLRYVFCEDYANHPSDGKGHWMNGAKGIVERDWMRKIAVRVLSEGVTP